VRSSVTPALAAPISFGILRAEVCVPERALTELAPDELRAMLAHELAHVVRRDPLWLALAGVLERVLGGGASGGAVRWLLLALLLTGGAQQHHSGQHRNGAGSSHRRTGVHSSLLLVSGDSCRETAGILSPPERYRKTLLLQASRVETCYLS
jgi:hypothetical protein